MTPTKVKSETIIKIFAWLRNEQCATLSAIKIFGMNQDQTIIAFTSYWIDGDSDASYCVDTKKIISDGIFNNAQAEYNLQDNGCAFKADPHELVFTESDVLAKWQDVITKVEYEFGYLCNACSDEDITENDIKFIDDTFWGRR